MVIFHGDRAEIYFHPQYLSEAEELKRIDDFAIGKAKHLIGEGYLFRHRSENPTTAEGRDKWASRCERTFNENDIKPLLQSLKAHLNQEINWGDISDNPILSGILSDATGKGHSAKLLHQRKSELMLKHGRYGVLVDGPAQVADNRAEAAQTQERSYQVLYTSRQIKDWSYFDSGEMRGGLSTLLVDAPHGSSVDGKPLERFHYFMAAAGSNFIRLTLEQEDESKQDKDKKKYRVIETVQGSLPYIPFVIVGESIEESSFTDSVEIAHDLFNIRSILQNINYYQGFKQSVITGATGDEIIGMAEFMVTLIKNPDADIKELSAGDPIAIEKEIRRKENKLKRMTLKQYSRIASDESAAVESAESKAQDQKALIAYLDSLLDSIQHSENVIWSIHADYEGTELEPRITIARDFELDDVGEIQARRSLVFMRAEKLGVVEIQKQILKQDLAEMDVIPDGNESEEDARARLESSVDATAKAPSLSAFRPSISELV